MDNVFEELGIDPNTFEKKSLARLHSVSNIVIEDNQPYKDEYTKIVKTSDSLDTVEDILTTIKQSQTISKSDIEDLNEVEPGPIKEFEIIIESFTAARTKVNYGVVVEAYERNLEEGRDTLSLSVRSYFTKIIYSPEYRDVFKKELGDLVKSIADVLHSNSDMYKRLLVSKNTTWMRNNNEVVDVFRYPLGLVYETLLNGDEEERIVINGPACVVFAEASKVLFDILQLIREPTVRRFLNNISPLGERLMQRQAKLNADNGKEDDEPHDEFFIEKLIEKITLEDLVSLYLDSSFIANVINFEQYCNELFMELDNYRGEILNNSGSTAAIKDLFENIHDRVLTVRLELSEFRNMVLFICALNYHFEKLNPLFNKML